MPDDRDTGESRRQLARRQRRSAGDRSARIAHTLMGLPPAKLDRLGLDEELREVVDKARAVTALGARRREERSLAGALRRIDLRDLQDRLTRIEEGAAADGRNFQLAETWRTRLLDEGEAAAAAFVTSFPAASSAAFAVRLDDARRERTTGRPKGAARALFRQIVAVMAAPVEAAADDAAADDPDDA